MTLEPPFALFVLSRDIDTEYINYSLRRAWRGNFMASWDFWVATDIHSDIPKRSSKKELAQGTVAPLPGSFSSPWIGKSIRDCAKWLQKAPADVVVNRRYFTVMDESSRGTDTVMVCRITQSTKSGDVDAEYFPQPTDLVALHMVTNSDHQFDAAATKYRASRGSTKSKK